MIELVVGIVFAAIILAVPYIYDKMGIDVLKRLKMPKLSFSRKKEVEEKLKEVDEKLEEVVSSGVSKREEIESKVVEKIVPLDDAAKTVQIDENLLEEMETASTLEPELPETESEETTNLPDIPELPELNYDLDVDVDDLENEIKLEPESEDEEEEEVEEVDFDEEDDLISSIAKEVEIKEEEELDLLRDMKGQKFSAEELKKELEEALQRLKALQG